MNKKELAYFEGLVEDGQHCFEAVRILYEAYHKETEAGDAWTYAEKWHRTFRETFGERQAEAEHAFEGGQRAEAKLLGETLDDIFIEVEGLCQILLAVPGNPPEGMDIEMEIAYQSMTELTRIFSYSQTLSEDYVKAEARTRKLENYKVRSHECLMQGFQSLLHEDNAAEVVFWKDSLERLERITARIAEAAGMYQRLTECYI